MIYNRQSKEERTGIRKHYKTMLENIDFADDIALLTSTMNHHQFQTIKLKDKSAKGGMKVKCLVLQSAEANQQE